jgi:DNA polymerase alpha/epsilon subunit B
MNYSVLRIYNNIMPPPPHLYHLAAMPLLPPRIRVVHSRSLRLKVSWGRNKNIQIIPEGVYYLEDMTGQVPISLAQRVSTPHDDDDDTSYYITEHSILLVEGYYHDGVVYIVRMGPPLQETRTSAMQYISQQVSHPAYTYRTGSTYRDDPIAIQQHDQDDISFLLLQDLHMDQPRVVQQLEGLLSTYESKYNTASSSGTRPTVDTTRLPVFVCMGNFISSVSTTSVQQQPYAFVQTIKAALEELFHIISKFPFLSQYGQFIIVPGPNDTLLNHVLPFPSFTRSILRDHVATITLQQQVQHVHYTSNPCRIRYQNYQKEMVIFRYDLLHLFQQHQIRLPNHHTVHGNEHDMSSHTTTERYDSVEVEEEEEEVHDDTNSDSPHCRMLKTVLDQGHLLPISSVPVHWNFSHSFGLYPLPDCLVLAGNHPPATAPSSSSTDKSSGGGTAPTLSSGSYENYWDCDVIQTISFDQSAHGSGSGGAFTIYRPSMMNEGNDDRTKDTSATAAGSIQAKNTDDDNSDSKDDAMFSTSTSPDNSNNLENDAATLDRRSENAALVEFGRVGAIQ